MTIRQGMKAGTIKTTNPQSVTLAGTIQPFAGDTSSWPVINGVKQKRGWAVCEGAVLEQSTYPDLFANLGSTWNAFNHPSDGAPTVGGSQFALPNLKGLYLGGAGANGDSTFTLGSFAADLTGANGLSNSSSSVSVSGTTANDTHNHGITDPGHNHDTVIPVSTDNTQGGSNTRFTSRDSFSTSTETTGITINNDTHNHTFTASGTASAQSISGDAETRPKTAPVGYIIALYDNVAAGALGLPEATAETAGIVTLNKSQVKYLSTDVNTNTTGVASLAFNGLTVGKQYRFTGQVYHVINAVLTTALTRFQIIHDGSVVARSEFRQDDANGLTREAAMGLESVIFVATSTTASVNVVVSSTNCRIVGNTTANTTWLQIEEINNNTITTDFT